MRRPAAVLVVLALTAACPAQMGLIPGDLNYDDQVSLLDYNIVKANFGRTPAWYEIGDANNDGQVGLLDYNVVKQWFGYTRGDPMPVQATPEPATAIMLAVYGAVLLSRRRRR